MGYLRLQMSSMPPPMQPEQPQQAQYQPPKKNNSVLWIVLAVVGIGGCFFLMIVAAIVFPVFAQARLAAVRTMSLSHIKQLATATLVYTTDYDDRLPADMSSYQVVDTELEKYWHDARFSPTEMIPGEHATPNAALAGTKTTDSLQPDTVELYTFSSPKIRGYEIKAFLDGHAKSNKIK